MSYKEFFSSTLDLGFKIDEWPVKLIDKSYRNDICPSFYFIIKNKFYILWADYQEKKSRENPESNRYTLVHGINEGDDDYPEIYDDISQELIMSSENIAEIQNFVNSKLLR